MNETNYTNLEDALAEIARLRAGLQAVADQWPGLGCTIPEPWMSKHRHYRIGFEDGKARVAVIARRTLDLAGENTPDTRLQDYNARLTEAQVKYPIGCIVEYQSRARGGTVRQTVLDVGMDAVFNIWLKVIPIDTTDEMMIDYFYPDAGCTVVATA